MREPEDDADRLNAWHRRLLIYSSDSWCDCLEEEVGRLASGELLYEDVYYLRLCLPPILLERYDARFLARFTRTSRDLGLRMLADPNRPWPSCVAEELALIAITEHAAIIDEHERPADAPPFDAGDYRDIVLQDEDVLMLWNREGRQAIVLDVLDFANLDFESWFEPFANAAFPVAPDPGREDTTP